MHLGNYTLLLLTTFPAFIATFSTSVRGKNVQTLFKRSDSEGSCEDSVSEHDSLTPIENTDSAPSDHGRKYTTGKKAFHRKMYKFYDRKMKYHKIFAEEHQTRGWREDANEHYAESASSKQKKIKHKKQFKVLLEGNMKPGKKTPKNDAIKKKDFPQITKETVNSMRRNKDYIFNRQKGHHYLVGRLQVEEKPKTAAPVEQVKSTSPISLPPRTMEEMKRDRDKLKQAKIQQAKIPTSSSHHNLPTNKHHDEEAKVYYGAKTTATTARRLPVQKLGGGGNHSASSSHSSDGHSSGESLHKPLLDKSKAHH